MKSLAQASLRIHLLNSGRFALDEQVESVARLIKRFRTRSIRNAASPADDAVKGIGRPRVVIVGAGFGGIEAAKALRGVPVDVIVIDRQNHHCFQPLLYQVATAALSPADVAWPIRHMLARQKNATVLMEVSAIDTAAHNVQTPSVASATTILSSPRGRRTLIIVLLDAGPRILPALSDELSRYGDDALRKMGVEVRTSSPVTNCRSDGIEFGGNFLRAGTIVWVAGVVQAPRADRPARLALLEPGAHLFSDWSSKPVRGRFQLGVAIRDVSTRRPPHHRSGCEARGSGESRRHST